MKILKEMKIADYSDKFIEPNTPVYEFITKLNSFLNKEEDFLKLISSIKFWSLPKISLWSLESILNYIDDLFIKYSKDLTEITIENKLKPLLNFVLLLLKNSTNVNIFESMDNLEIIFLKTFDIKLKIVIIEIYTIYSNSIEKPNCRYISQIANAGYAFMDMRRVLMEFINNNYQFNEKIFSYLEEILLKLQKRWEKIFIKKGKKIQEKNPFVIFKEIIYNNKDYQNRNDFLELKNIYEYYAYNEQIFDTSNNNLLEQEGEYIVSVNNFFCVLNFLCMINNTKIDTKKIYLGFKFTFSLLNICCSLISNFEERLINEEYKESFTKDAIEIMTTKIDINVKLEFLNYYLNLPNLNNGYEYIFFQNGFSQALLCDFTHQNNNKLILLTKEESYNQILLKIVLEIIIKYAKMIPGDFMTIILFPPKDNIYLYSLENVLFFLETSVFNEEIIITKVLIPRLLYELEHLNSPQGEIKYININENDENVEYPNLIDRVNVIIKIYKIIDKFINRATNIDIANKIYEILSGPFKSLILNEEMKKNVNYNSVYINIIYLLLKICNAFPTIIPKFISEDIFQLIFDYFSNNIPKEHHIFYIIFFAIYVISIHEKGVEFILENNKGINMINAVFNKIKKDEGYFYGIDYLEDLIIDEFSLWINIIKNKSLCDVINCFYDNFISFLEMVKEEYINLKIDFNEKNDLNLKQYLLQNKLVFIFRFLFPNNINNYNYEQSIINQYENKIKQVSKTFYDFLEIPNFLLSNSFTLIYIKFIISINDSTKKFFYQFLTNFNEFNRKISILNLHQNQKDKILHNYYHLAEICFQEIYVKDEIKKDDFYNFCSINSKILIQRINEKANIDLFFMKYNGNCITINDDIHIQFLSNKLKSDVKKSLMEMLKECDNQKNKKFIVLNEDNYLEIKTPPLFKKQIKMEFVDDVDYIQLSKEFVHKNTENETLINDTFDFIEKIGGYIKSSKLSDIKENDIKIIKNFINLGYILSLILKYFRKTIFENMNEEAEIIKNLIKLKKILSCYIYIFTENYTFEISSIVYFYFIKFKGVRQLFKIAYKLMELCKKECNKKEIPIIESLLLSKVWEKIYSLISLFAYHLFTNNDGYYLILILESELTKKLIYRNELNAYTKYIILRDLKEVFFKNDEINEKIFQEMELCCFQIYKLVIFIIENFWRQSKIIDEELNYKKLYKKGCKVYEIMHFVQQGFIDVNKILDKLKNLKISTKNKNDIKTEEKIEKINDVLINIENYEPYPESKFILLMKKTIDIENKIFKSQKDKENKNINNFSLYLDYSLEKFSVMINNVKNIIINADLSKNEINNIRRQNLNFRTRTKESEENIVLILQNDLKALDYNINNFFINEELKLEKELKIKMRINYNFIKFYKMCVINIENREKLDDIIIQYKIINKNITSIRNIIINYKNNIFKQFNQLKLQALIYENIVSIYLVFKFLKKIKKVFDTEKKLFMDIFQELLQYESENTNQDKRLINEKILIMLLLNIIHNFNDIKILIPYLQKGLFNKILHLKFYKENTYKNFYENNFKLQVTLDECFKQFVLMIFTEEKIFQNLIENVLLYAWANLKTQNENNEIYLEDFLSLCADYAQNYGSIFQKALLNLFEIIQVKVKERPSRNINEHGNKKRNALRLKCNYEQNIINIKNDLKITEYKDDITQTKNEEISNSKNKNKKLKQNLSDINKTLFGELLKHIWACTIKLEKDVDKNMENKVNIKKYMIDLDTSLIALISILHSFPSYLYLVLTFHKGKRHKINFIDFLIKKILPLLNYDPYNIYNNYLEEINDSDKVVKNPNYLNDKDKIMMDSFRKGNIIKKLIHSMTYRRRNMNEDEIFLMKKIRKKLLFAIDDSLKEINTKFINDFNVDQIEGKKPNKTIILYQSNLVILYSMTEYFKENHLYSQYNPFEITRIIFSEGCDVVKSLSNILKNMKIYNNNQIFHEMGVMYLHKLMKYIHKNTKNKENNMDLYFYHNSYEEEEMDEDIESDLDNENEENEEENREENEFIESPNNSTNRRGIDNDENINNYNRNNIENEEDIDLMDVYNSEEENEEEINENNKSKNSESKSNTLKEGNDNNFNNIENNLNLNNVIERGNLNHLIFEQNNHYDDEDNPDYDDVRGESEDFEEEEEFIDEYNDEYNEQYPPLFIDEYSEDDYNSYSSSEELDEEMISNSFLRMDAECDFSMRFSENLINNYDDMNLFKDENNKNSNNCIWYDLYFEDSLSFMFSFSSKSERNDLIHFYKSDLKIKFFIKRKNFGNFEKICDLFIYKYIVPIDDLNPFYNFIFVGSSESTIHRYMKFINKIKNNFLKLLRRHSNYNNIHTQILKELRNNILKEIKDKNPEKKENKIDIVKQKENDKDKNKEIKFNWNIPSNYYYLPRLSISSRSSEYLFYPFIHFDGLDEDNKEKKETTEKEDKNKKEENDKDSIKIEEEDNQSETKEKPKIEKKEDIKCDEDEKSKNKERIDDNNKSIDRDDFFNENNDKKSITNDQFIIDLPNELREDILLNLDPTLVPNLSNELRAEYYRLMGNDSIKLPKNSAPILPHINLSIDKPNKNEEDPAKDSDIESSDQFIYKDIELVKYLYIEEEILMNTKCYKKNIDKKMKEFDDDFTENLLIYNINNILWKKMVLFNNNNDISSNSYFQLISDFIFNVQLRHKIIDLFFILWIYDISYIKNLSNPKIDLEKNSFLKRLNYLYLEKDSFNNMCVKYYDQFFFKIMSNYPKKMNKYFTNFKFDESGSYSSIKDKKKYSITKNAKYIKNILNIKYDKNKNVLENLIKIAFNRKSNKYQTIYKLQIFTDIIKQCKRVSKDGNNIILSKINNNTINIDEITIEKIIELFDDFRIALNSKKDASDNNPTLLLEELLNDKNNYQIVYDKLRIKTNTLKEQITKEINISHFNTDKIFVKVNFKNPLPDIILVSILKFVGNLCNNIYIKYETKSKDINDKNNKMKIELLTQFRIFIGKITENLYPCWEKLNNFLNQLEVNIKDNEINTETKFLFFPFFESFFCLSYLYIYFYAKDNKENSTQFIIEKNYKSEQKSPLRNELITFNDSAFIQFFYKFCEDNKTTINFLYKKFPNIIPQGLILFITKILNLENKKKYFREELRKLPYKEDYLRIKVRRNGPDLFADSFGSLSSQKPEQWRSRLIITFEGEEAVDAGGVKREWLTILSKEMFNPNYLLFTLAKNGTTYTINADSGKYNYEHLKQFEFIGKIMAKAIYDGMMLDCYFTRIIYKLITNTPISYHDMEDYDPVFYKSIKILLENDYTGRDTYLTYSYNHDNFGEMQIIDLIENGRNIDVTEENKFDYVQKLCSAKLYDTIKPQVKALLKGFYQIIPQKLISIFNYRELELVISGLPTIDIKDWKKNTLYENYTEETPIIKYFWEIIESYDNNERAEFLQFVTGSSKVPLEGFRALQGIGGVNKFLISKVFDKNFDRLPTAHTCTNQLDLPEYPNKEILKQRLKFAIKEGKGFGFV